MTQPVDFLDIATPSSAYKDLREAHLLRDDISCDDEEVPAEDWLSLNAALERAADDLDIDATPELSIAQQQVNLTDLVSQYLTVDGKPFSFLGREYLRGVYDYFVDYPEGCRNILLLSSRQIEKSTTQSAKSCALAMANPAYKTLYIAPRYDQVIIFSQQRFKPMCEDSPQMMRTFVDPNKCLWQVKARQFTNGAFFNFRSCYLNADNARGISANHLLIDEIQDIVPDAIPVLEECQAHSPDNIKYNLYAGTPKSTANIITLRWENSCMFEWLTKCSGCNHWNMNDESIIQDDKYACARCGKAIDIRNDGVWVPKKPSLLHKRWGFRITQMMVPFKEHKHIVAKRDDPNISRAKYLNETLGLPYDEGEMGITDAVLERACKDYDMLQPADIVTKYKNKGFKIYAGVDYGTAEGSNPSFTVLTIGAMLANGIFRVLFMKKFKGSEADSVNELNLIDRLCRTAGVDWIGADWGHGAHQNARLERERGWQRVGAQDVLMEFRYVTQKKEMTWNGKYYHIDRNQTMGRTIDAIRKCDELGGIQFFRYPQFTEFRPDLTTIYLEYNHERGTYSYQHQLPDDAFHSINYAYIAARQGSGLGLPSGLPSI